MGGGVQTSGTADAGTPYRGRHAAAKGLALVAQRLGRGLRADWACRLAVLRKLGHVDEEGVVQLKGRAACELDTADELLTTELMFNGVFGGLDRHQLVALVSCLVPVEKSQVGADPGVQGFVGGGGGSMVVGYGCLFGPLPLARRDKPSARRSRFAGL